MNVKLFLIIVLSLFITTTVSAQMLTKEEKRRVETLIDNVAARNGISLIRFTTDKDSYICEEFEELDTRPFFNGNLSQWLSQNMTYPLVAAENGIQGQVIVSFVIDTNGSITNVGIARSVDPSLDREAVRVVCAMPKWTPGYKNGVPVRVRISIPLSFRLQ